ncbi:MAG: tetratricopeptide repeat protein [Verrucomicrobiota bacterium]
MKLREKNPSANSSDTSQSCPQGQRGLWQRLAFGIGLITVVMVGFMTISARTRGPALGVPVPQDVDKLEAQLRLYILEQVKWVRQAPRDARRHAILGMVYAANSIWPEARLAFRNAATLDPKEPLAQLYVAVATQEMGDFDESLKLYRQVTVRFPNFAPALYRLGDALLRAGAVDEAENVFRRLIALAPQEWRGFAGLGDVKLRKGNYQDAANDLERAIQIDPNAKVAHHLLGLAYRGLGRLEDAQRELSLGVNATKYPMPDAWSATAQQHMKSLQDQFEMAAEYGEAGQPEKAVALLETALIYHPDNPNVMNNLAIAYNRAGQPQKARSLLLKVIQIDTNNLPAYIALAASCQELDLNAEALAHAERAVRLAPTIAQPHLAKASVLLAMAQDAEALAELRVALSCDPRNAEIEIEMGDVCLRNLDQPGEALKHYQQAIQLEPAFVGGHVRLAEVLIRLRDSPGARKAIEDLRKLAPTEPALVGLEARFRNLVNR